MFNPNLRLRYSKILRSPKKSLMLFGTDSIYTQVAISLKKYRVVDIEITITCNLSV